MSQEYVFEYPGTKQMFLDSLRKYSHTNDDFFYFNDYIIKIVGDEVHFGIERAGHSGGFWFIPQIIEYENKIEFRGEIQYIGPVDNRKKFEKIKEGILTGLFTVLFLPFVLIVVLASMIYDKIVNRKKDGIKTKEDKLFNLLENYLGCTRKPTEYN